MSRGLLAAFALMLGLSGCAVASAEGPAYAVSYTAKFLPHAGSADIEISTRPDSGRLIALDFNMPPAIYAMESGDGSVVRTGNQVQWTPPRAGGRFRFRVVIDQRRAGGGYDSRITADSIITRGDHLFPPARVRATKGSRSKATVHFELPQDWRDVETPFRRIAGNTFAISNPARNFDRPTGWIAAGNLVSTRETLAGTRVTVTAPRGAGADQVATLAILRHALPEMRDAFGKLPEKLLIVRGEDPMWRGGLSAPSSLWLHADRPLLSQNGTSPILHELTHSITRIRGGPDDDWIAEGLAEFYSLELGRRAKLISDKRFAKAIRLAGQSGRKVHALRAAESAGDRTRKAVALFAALDMELQTAGSDIDALTALLIKRDGVSLEQLQADARKLLGHASRVLAGID